MARSMKDKIAALMFRKDSIDYWWSLRQKAIGTGCRLIRLWHVFRYQRLMDRHCASIPLSVRFGSVPKFPHGLSGVFISSQAELGSGCTIFQQVTIGSNTLSDSRHPGSPKIGDNAYIGAGAKIIGGVTVGSGVRVGANCVVTRDVPDNATVVLPQPVIIAHGEARDNRFTPITQFRNQAE